MIRHRKSPLFFLFFLLLSTKGKKKKSSTRTRQKRRSSRRGLWKTRRTREVGVARKTPFLFYSNFFVWSWFVFFCVGDSKKKISSQRTQKKTTKSTRERTSFLDGILYARTHLYICAFKTSSDRKTRSLFTSVCFSFVGVYSFITKTDIHYIESALFFWSRACIFSPLPPQKKGEANFSSVFQRGWAATNAPRQNCAPTFTSGCEWKEFDF